MVLNILVIGIILGLTWIWASKGFFNALIQFTIVLVAGAVAFGLWEPLAHLILNNFSDRTGFMGLFEGVAWSAGLLLPFAITVLVLRLAVDQVLKFNVKNPTAVDYAGGGVLGLGTATITAGIFVIAFGFARLGTNFLGYNPVATDQTPGSVVKAGGLWVPVDRATAGLYGFLSETTLRTGEPLAKWYPNLTTTGYAIKTSQDGGAARNVLREDDFTVTGSYRIGSPQSPQPASELLQYRPFDQPQPRPQRYVDLEGETVQQGYVQGYVVQFDGTAGEEGGQILIGNTQLRLVAARTDDPSDTIDIHPFAMVSQTRAGEDEVSRWRFESPETYIPSVGAASRPVMAFEFLVPTGYEPRGLSIKNMRVRVDRLQEAPAEYEDWRDRDQAVTRGRIFDIGGTRTAGPVDQTGDRLDPTEGDWFKIGIDMPISFEKRQAGGMQFRTEGQGNRVRNFFISGTRRFRTSEINQRGGIDSRALIINRFDTPADVNVVQLDVNADSPVSLLRTASISAGLDAPFRLVDENGQVYEACGYLYEDDDESYFRYTPGDFLTGVRDLPEPLSAARTDQRTLILFFQVSVNTEITEYRMGDTQIARFRPAAEIDPPRSR